MVIYGLKVFALLVLASLVFGRPAAVMQSTQGAGQDTGNIKRSFEVALSGGVAGGFATGLLYPIDTLKTIRQSDRSLQSVSEAFETVRSSGVVTLYSGVLPAVLGSMPSSALYFGAYEGAKAFLHRNFGRRESSGNLEGNVGQNTRGGIVLSRPAIHMVAAATGNIASSLVFVPKEAIKQKLQAINTGAIAFPASGSVSSQANVGVKTVVRHIWRTSGLKGFYPSYRATLMRNIPSAVVRFTVYEELKHIGRLDVGTNKIGILLVGAAASALSSACTTPLDVVKTRLATGKLARGTKVFAAISDIANKEGLRGLYSGVQERAVWSAMFGGVGLASFETCKGFALSRSREGEGKPSF